ncbi:MAG: hypothetical protein HYZ84_03615 [Candidatus Omnitrophica bacterium]|nr:hypothetical protein [Candidatus Omnitrophota bacterium]
MKLQPTGRPAKSTTSIVDKLHRESIRLSQLQDIAGCRIVVKDIQEQNSVAELIQKAFPFVRTILQHNWAELSEKFSDTYDPLIKYGGGKKASSKEIQEFLLRLSKNFENCEQIETELESVAKDLTDESQKAVVKNLRNDMEKLKVEWESLTKFQIKKEKL